MRQSLNCYKQEETVKLESMGLQLLSLADIKVFILFSPKTIYEVNTCQKLWILQINNHTAQLIKNSFIFPGSVHASRTSECFIESSNAVQQRVIRYGVNDRKPSILNYLSDASQVCVQCRGKLGSLEADTYKRKLNVYAAGVSRLLFFQSYPFPHLSED